MNAIIIDNIAEYVVINRPSKNEIKNIRFAGSKTSEKFHENAFTIIFVEQIKFFAEHLL